MSGKQSEKRREHRKRVILAAKMRLGVSISSEDVLLIETSLKDKVPRKSSNGLTYLVLVKGVRAVAVMRDDGTIKTLYPAKRKVSSG